MAKSIDKKNRQAVSGNNKYETAGPSFRLFMWGKIKRLLPYHILAFILLYFEDIFLHEYSILQLIKNTIDCIPSFLLIQKLGFQFRNLNSVEWYISAMLISMAIIFVISYIHFDYYSKCIAPVISMVLIGWLIHDFGTVSGASQWDIFGYRCVWRAFAELNAGLFAYETAEFMKRCEWKTGERCVLSLIELLSVAMVIIYGVYDLPGKYDVFAIMGVFLIVTIAFSDVTPGNNVLSNRITSYMGKLSLPMYLNQLFAIYIIRKLMNGYSYSAQFSSVLVLTFIVSVLTLLIGDLMMRAIDNSSIDKKLSN